MRGLLRVLATFGPVGYTPIAPATAGSAVVALAGWFIPAPGLAEALALIGVGTVVAAWAAGEAEKDLGHDAKPIVIDEAIGQSLALLFVPHTIVAFATSSTVPATTLSGVAHCSCTAARCRLRSSSAGGLT